MKHPGLSRALLAAVLLVLFCLHTGAAAGAPQELPRANPAALGFTPAHLQNLDDAVEAAIRAGEMPGAVVLIARGGSIAYLKAFGNRAVSPAIEPMTEDTIFDMASLTKVMATTPAILQLAERGLIRIDDKVKRYLPRFVGHGKDAITVRQLLTHYSGLRPDFDLSKPWEGRAAALDELWKEETQGEPGKDFVYSDLNFIALGEIVHAVSGKPLDLFTQENIYEPLRMTATSFKPPAEWQPRIAPTESRHRSLVYLKGQGTPPQAADVLRGDVHDPTAWRMGGVAGHAGLFSCARDASIYAQCLLDGGLHADRRILSPLAVRAMTTPQSPRLSPALRGFGWDIETSFSSPRGDLYGAGYGHTGFTGTSLWIHPPTRTFVIILSNRVHPDGKGDATHLRGVIANIVASSEP